MSKKKTQPKPKTPEPETQNPEPQSKETQNPEPGTQNPNKPMVELNVFMDAVYQSFQKRLSGKLQWQRHEALSELRKAANDALRVAQ